MSQFNKLLFGGYSGIFVNTTDSQSNKLTAKEAIKALAVLSDKGVSLKNAEQIANMSVDDVNNLFKILESVSG